MGKTADGGRSGTDRRRHLSIPGVRPWLGVFPLWRAVHHAGGGGGPDREPRHPPFPPTKAHVPRPGLAAVAPPYSGLARLGSGPGCRRSASQGSDRLILRLIVGCPCSTLTPGSPGQCGLARRSGGKNPQPRRVPAPSGTGATGRGEDGPRRLPKIAEVWPKLAEVGRSLVAEVCPKVPFLKIIYHYLINIVARGSLSLTFDIHY